MGEVFYHYTSVGGAKGIMRDKIIKASSSEHGDATFGDGVYLTKLSPMENGQHKIWLNNYDGIVRGTLKHSQKRRVERAVKLTFPSNAYLPQKQGTNRDVYLHHGDLGIQNLEPKVDYVVLVQTTTDTSGNLLGTIRDLSSSNQDSSRFLITVRHGVDKTAKAVLQYELVGEDTLDMYHTGVPPEFRGKGVAKVLAKAAMDYAVESDKKMILSCSYLQKYLADNPRPEYTQRLAQL